ncbi:family 16 glycosylhydrolase [Plebeiibacterium sediminum]|uniref:Family 16 glycosylhydrolase n=1 Tax=Plebeiibacterium sediminum TaxID=2992112 RepID=A0AAE3M1W9_9BACT|nr:family 16 glycosylhydrolase [Plebeiobacterium sediminum]MCW3785771.1 family 16 glycosylhydrolase [Plebeiobacterium sediminum]
MKHILTVLVLLLTLITSACSEDKAVVTYELILDKSTLNLTIGEKSIINVVEAPATNEPVVWTSDNETVASVFYGNVTALAGGTAIITATVGDYSAQCEVVVPEPEYQLVWEDNFDGTTLNDDNWTIEVNGNGGGNQELQYYTDRPENVRLEDGCLVLEARKEPYSGKQYTSGRIISKNKQDFTYGKMEARLKVPHGKGTWPAFWMLGYGSWPRCGEIDIMEHVGYDPKTFHCALHTQNKNGMNGQNVHGEQTLDNDVADEFHVLTMEWVQNEFMGYDRIHIYVDGVETKTFGETTQLQDSGDWPFNDRFYFILNLAIGGNWGGAQGVDDSMFNEPVLFKVDYVKVYQLK